MSIEERMQREAVEELAELEKWIKAQPSLTPEAIEEIREKVHEEPEQKRLDAEIKQLRAVRDHLDPKK